MMRRFLEWAAMALAALGVTSCASTMTVGSHVARTLDFSQYRTYDWGPADALPTGDPRLDKDPYFKDHVQGAVEKQLARRGLQLSTASATPDLRIHYHANIAQRIDPNRTDRAYGYCEGDGCLGGLVDYEAGTLVLDIIDVRTNKLIWRGWAQDSVEDMLDNPDRMAKTIDEAVTEMLRRLPKAL